VIILALNFGQTRLDLIQKYYSKKNKLYASAINDYGTILSITDRDTPDDAAPIIAPTPAAM
jgi:hypothetical protein